MDHGAEQVLMHRTNGVHGESLSERLSHTNAMR
jgi:hypothetical protein